MRFRVPTHQTQTDEDTGPRPAPEGAWQVLREEALLPLTRFFSIWLHHWSPIRGPTTHKTLTASSPVEPSPFSKYPKALPYHRLFSLLRSISPSSPNTPSQLSRVLGAWPETPGWNESFSRSPSSPLHGFLHWVDGTTSCCKLPEGREEALSLHESSKLITVTGRGGVRGAGAREGLQAKGLVMRGKV